MIRALVNQGGCLKNVVGDSEIVDLENQKLLELNKSLSELAQRYVESLPFDNLVEGFLKYVFTKGYITHLSIIKLCEIGHGQDAGILARSLFELVVTVKYVLLDSEYRIQRWLDYDWVVRSRMLQYAKKDKRLREAIANRELKQYDDDPKTIEAKAKETQDKYKYEPAKAWSEKSIYGMAKEVGLKHEYETIYGIYSNMHHSAARAVNEYFKIKADGELDIDAGRSGNMVNEALVSSFHFYGMIVDICNDKLSLNLEKELEVLVNTYEEIVKSGIE